VAACWRVDAVVDASGEAAAAIAHPNLEANLGRNAAGEGSVDEQRSQAPSDVKNITIQKTPAKRQKVG